MCINIDKINVLLENDVPELILQEIFKSEDIDMADAKH
jgi:hypothetical protein